MRLTVGFTESSLISERTRDMVVIPSVTIRTADWPNVSNWFCRAAAFRTVISPPPLIMAVRTDLSDLISSMIGHLPENESFDGAKGTLPVIAGNPFFFSHIRSTSLMDTHS